MNKRRYKRRKRGEIPLARLTINLSVAEKKKLEDLARSRRITVSRLVSEAATENLKNEIVVFFSESVRVAVTLKSLEVVPVFLRGFYDSCSGDCVEMSGTNLTLLVSNLNFLSLLGESISSLSLTLARPALPSEL